MKATCVRAQSDSCCGRPCCGSDFGVKGVDAVAAFAHSGMEALAGAFSSLKLARVGIQHGSCGSLCGNGIPRKCQCDRQQLAWQQQCCSESSESEWYATTDIKLEARIGERRIVPFAIENNRPKAAQIALRVDPQWIDASGHTAAAAPIAFSPGKTVVLGPGETTNVEAIIEVRAPLQEDRVYYARILLDGCAAEPISLGLLVLSDSLRHRFVCDPCRMRRSPSVEFCCETDETRKCGTRQPRCRHSTSCQSSCGCEWPGSWDPHKHWTDHGQCSSEYLTR
jgi:hypothetical protein